MHIHGIQSDRGVSFASAGTERLPEEAKGKTSKRNARNIGKSKLPAGKMPERIYKVKGLTEYETRTEWTLYPIRVPVQVVMPVKAQQKPSSSLPVDYSRTGELRGQYSVVNYAVCTRLQWRYVRLMHKDGYLFVRTFPVSAGEAYATNPIQTVWNPTVSAVITHGPKKERSYIRPIVSATNIREARFLVSILKLRDPSERLNDWQDRGRTQREQYARSLGVELPEGHIYRSLRLRGKRLPNGQREQSERVRAIRRTYEQELERRIALAIKKKSPAWIAQEYARELRNERRAENNRNRERNIAYKKAQRA